MKRKTIIAAVGPESEALITQALGASFDLMFCPSLPRALAALDERADVILCGIHFDDGKMLDLLRHAKAGEQTRAIPFVCLRLDNGRLTPSLIRGVEAACKALGSECFLNLAELALRHGEQAAGEKLRAVVEDLALSGIVDPEQR